MQLIARDLPALVFLLLPGFIAAGVFYTLTAHPKASEFERLIQSLIFTAFVRVAVNILRVVLFGLGTNWKVIGTWDADIEFNWSILLAIIMGLIFALLANKDWFHRLMRFSRLTNRTS